MSWLRFARHEMRLAWRDFLYLMTAGDRWRARNAAIGLGLVAVFLHLFADQVVGRYAGAGDHPDKAVLVVVTGSALLSWSVMLAQAIESVTRGFYARSDLDLLLTAPVPPGRIFAVRLGAMAVSTTLMALALATPVIDVLAWRGGVHWLLAYGVVVAMGLTTVAVAVGLTGLLFRVFGPRRTRLVAQIVAAVIGAAFLVAVQTGAILSYGATASRFAFLQSPGVMRLTPDAGSVWWWPARAMLGDPRALAAVLAASVLLFGSAVRVFAPLLGGYAIAAAGVGQGEGKPQRSWVGFRGASALQALRRKEWVLLARDPWLLSQSLMQLLYLLPAVVLMWRNFAGRTGAIALLVPVLIMAAGQLAGGLAWLAVSGEDAPDLIATAPVGARPVLRAKIEAVIGATGIVFLPFLAVLAVASAFDALVAASCIALASGAATAIQLWFRSQAKRSYFRRRQTSSRIATFAEAFSSVSWAATGALAAAGTWTAAVPGVLAVGILAGAWAVSPRRV